jgi:hypothetical protein
MTPPWGIAISAVLIGIGLALLTLRRRADQAAGFDRMAGYLLLVVGVCGVFVSVAAWGA